MIITMMKKKKKTKTKKNYTINQIIDTLCMNRDPSAIGGTIMECSIVQRSSGLIFSQIII